MYKKIVKYFSAHVMYNSLVHFLIGAGVGVLIASPFLAPHPVRWSLLLIALGLLGHIYPMFIKK